MGWEPAQCQPAAAQPGSKQEQPQSSSSSRRTLVLSLGVFLTAAAAVAALLSVLCVTALSCSASPHLSVTVRGSSGQQQQQHDSPHAAAAAGGVSWTGSSCPIAYKQVQQQQQGNHTTPLLLGGIAASCVTGCQPRDSMWSESCKMDPHSRTTWGLCEPQQRTALADLASSLHNGSMLDFHPCDLYQLVRGRTLWLIGDSHMKSTYTAIRCIMLDFWDHSQGECAASSDAAQQLELHKAELFAPRNLTLIDITEPRCLHLLGGGRICFLHAVRGETLVSGDTQKPGVLELVQQRQLASPDDAFYVSSGRWYTHNCSDFEAPPFNKSMWALSSHYQKTKGDWPHVFFGVPPFDHTTCAKAFDYKTAAACPAAGNGTSPDMYHTIASYAHAILDKSGMPIIDYMKMTIPLDWAHLGHERSFKSALDCLHYCRPGIPEMDVWHLYTAMKQRGIKPLSRSVVDTTADSSTYQTNLTCTRLKPFL